MSGALSLGDGIFSIEVPLPFLKPPAVNIYLIEGDAGLTMIDCGADWDEGLGALEDGFSRFGLRLGDVHTLIVSHLHPDHVGMAARVMSSTGARFTMHRKAASGVDRYNDRTGFVRETLGLAKLHGVPETELARFGQLRERPSWMAAVPAPDHLVDDGALIRLDAERSLEVLHTPGHEASHICLRDSRTGALFSGDHILPRIMPIIMVAENDGEDALGQYLESLRRIIDLRIGTTFPAHGEIIERGWARAEQLLLSRLNRIDTVRGHVVVPMTAWDLTLHIYRPHLGIVQQGLALREMIAHAEHLRLTGRLGFGEVDGIRRYEPYTRSSAGEPNR